MPIQTPLKRKQFANSPTRKLGGLFVVLSRSLHAILTLPLLIFVYIYSFTRGGLTAGIRVANRLSTGRRVALVLLMALSLTGIAVGLKPAATNAATSDTVNFQAKLLNANGAIAPDGYYDVRFKLYSGSSCNPTTGSGCTSLWSEDWYDSNGTTAGNDNRIRVANGYLTVNLGSQTAFPTTINWAQNLWISMNVAGTTQTATPTWTGGEMLPYLKLTAVPFAFSAGNLSNISSGGFTSTLSFQGATGGDQSFYIPDQGAPGNYSLLTQAVASGNYVSIQGTTPGTPQSGNFNVSGTGITGSFQSGQISIGATSASTVGLTIKGAASQTANLLEFQDNAGNVNGSISSGGNILTLGRAATSGTVSQGKITLADGTTDGYTLSLHTGTLTANSDVTIPNSGGNDTVCLYTLANCVGTGGGLAGSGTQNFISKFNSAGGNSLGNSSLFDNGSFLGLGTTTNSGLFSIVGSSTTQNGIFVQNAASATSASQVIKQASSQTGDLFQLQDNTGAVLSGFGSNGNLYYANATHKLTVNAATLTADQTITLPNESGTVCLQNSANCGFITAATANGLYIQLAPATAQTDSSTNASIFINDSGGGNLAQLQAGGTDKFVVANNGATTIANGLTVQAGGITATGNSTITGNLNVTGIVTATTALQSPLLQTAATSTASTNSAGITIQTGNATGTTSNSGSVTIDAGTATGTAGAVNIGTTNASAVTIGRTGITTTIAGNTGVTLSATTGATLVCQNASSLLSTCTNTYAQTNDTTNFIRNQTNAQAGNFNVAAASGVAAVIQGTTGQDIAQFKNDTAVTVANIDQTGAITATGFVGTYNVLNTNNSGSTGNVASNSLRINLSGTTTSGTNTTNGVSFGNVTPIASNTFYGLNFGTGYTDILRYSNTQLISGLGKLQDAGLDSSVNYSNLQNVTNLTATGNLTVANTGSVYTQAAADYTTVGSTNNVNLGAASLVRLNGASAQTLTGIAGGADGRRLTIINAGSTVATIANNNTSSTAANRITTGTGSNISLPAGASVELIYDATASLWRITSSVAATGGYTNGVTTVGAVSATSNVNGATISGNTINLTVADASNAGLVSTTTQAFQGAKTFNSLLTAGAGLTATGTVTFSSLGAGLAQLNSSGVLSSGAVDRNDSTYFNTTLSTANGGTGLTGFAANGVVYASSASALAQATGTSGQLLVANGSNVPTFTTLSGDATISSSGVITIANNAITSAKILDGTIADADLSTGTFTHITGTGALGAGSIASGFGTISTDNIIATTSTITGGTSILTPLLDTPGGTTTLNIGTTNATGGISLNQNVTISGSKSLTVGSGATTLGGSLSTKKGTDYSTTGSQNNVNFGSASLIRLTGASAQTITGIANGTDGYRLTIVNAGTQAATISDSSASSLAANRITTGTGADISLPAGASAELIYDSGANLWRVTSSVAATGGYTSGVTTVGAVSATSNANGATITGNTINLSVADASNAGLVSTTTQAFQGAKTFNSLLTAGAGLNAATINTTAGVNTTIGNSTGTFSVVSQGGFNLTTAGAITGVSSLTASGAIQGGSFQNANASFAVNAAGNVTAVLSATTGAALVCQNASNVLSTCTNTYAQTNDTTNFIRNQTTQQASSNFNISGTGLANILQAGTFDTGSAAVLNIGTTNATSISLNQNTTLAAGKNLSFTAGAGNFDQSASTGTFATGTGAATLNGNTNVVSGKSFGVNNSTAANPFAVNTLTTAQTGYQATISTNASSNNGLVVQGVASQSTTTNLLSVQNSTGGSLFSINGAGTVRSSAGLIFGTAATSTNSGSISKTYTAGTGGVTASDVVVLANDSGSSRAIDSTTAYDTRVLGVAASTATAGSGVDVVIGGAFTVNYTGTAPAIGDQLVVSATSGKVQVDNNATQGILGYATTAGASGTVGVRIQITSGQTNPTFQGNVTVGGSLQGTTASFSGSLSASGAITSGNSTTSGSVVISNGNGTYSTVLGSATTAQTYTLPAIGGTLLTGATADANYIKNGTTQQTSANFNIAAASGVAATIQGASGQNILNVNDSTGSTRAYFDTNGGLAVLSTLGVGVGTGTGAKLAVSSTTLGINVNVTGSGNILQLQNNGTSKVIFDSNGNQSTSANISITGAANFDQSASTGSFATGSGTVALNGNTTVAANRGLTLASGTGVLTQSYSNSATGAADVKNVTNGSTSGSVTTTGNQVNLTGTATTGANTVNAFNFTNVTAATNNSFNGLVFGTGYNNLLSSANATLSAAGNLNLTGTVNAGALQNTNGSFAVNGTGAVTASTGTFSGAITSGTSAVAGSLILTNGNGTNSTLISTATTAQTFSLPTTGGTLLTSATADTNYIKNQTSQQATSNFNISGTGIASTFQSSTSILTPLLDTPSGTTTLNIGTTNATGGINLNQNVAVANGKSLTVGTGPTSLGGSLSTKKGTDYSTVGSQNDVNFGATSLVRLTGASAQTITGIANGTDGYRLTIVNAGTTTATISNNSASSAAANRITTGTGTDINLPAGASVDLIYDSAANLWRVTSSVAASGGYTNGVTTVGAVSGTSNANGATITGNTINLSVADASNAGLVSTTTQAFQGAKTFNSLLSAGAGLTVTGTVTFSSLGAGLAQLNSSGVLSSGVVDRNSATYFNTTLSTANGGTGLTGFTANGIVYASSTSALAQATGTSGQLMLANGSNVPTFTTLSGDATISSTGAITIANSAITSAKILDGTIADTDLSTGTFTHITGTGALGAGSIANGFGTISTGNTIATTSTITGGTSVLTPLLDTPSGTTTLNIGTTNATAGISLNQNVTISGSKTLTVGTGATTLGGTLSTKKGTDFATTGTSLAANFGSTSLVRLTGATAQTIGGIANGTDGYRLTIVNAGTTTAVINNSNASATAANRITTGTGADVNLPVGATVDLIYDAGDNLWRVTSSVAATGGYTNGVTTVGTVNATSNANGATITGNTINLSVADASNAGLVSTTTQSFQGAKTFNSLVTAAAGLTATGTVTFSSLGAGLAQLNSSGVLSSGVVDRNSATYFNTTLSTANGGTGLTGFTANGIVYASSASALAQATGTSGQLMVANASNVPTFTTLSGDATLSSTGAITIANSAVTSAKILDGTIADADLSTGTFTHITGTGALGAGSIASGFGTISTGNTIATTSTITGGTSVLTPLLDTPGGTTTLNIGTTNATAGISLNQNVTVSGSKTLTVGTGLTSLGGGLNVTSGAANFTNNIATKKGSDFPTTGTSLAANFGATSLVRLTGATAQTISGIANGTDGYRLTIVNAGSATAVVSNNNASATAANRITTGTGADVNLPVGATVDLVYDAGDSLWRVTSSVAATGGYTNGVTTVGAVSGTSNANGATITGNTINLSVADASNAGLVSTTTQAFQGAKTFNSLLTAGAGLTATGTVTFSSLGAGLAQLNSSGVLSSGAVDRNSASYFNTTLSTANGGTGLTGFTANGIVYASSTSALAQATGTSGQLILANGSNVPTFTTLSGDATLLSTGVITIANSAVTSAKILDGTIADADLSTGTFTHITGTGALGAGSIASGFGTISTGNTIATTSTITGGTSILTPLLDTPSGTTTLNIGTTNATGGISLNQNVTVSGSKTLTVGTGLTSLGGGLNVTNGASNFTSNIATKKGTDFATTGTSLAANFGATSLVRLTGATAQTIGGIANGTDGYRLTIVNAGSATAVISNSNASATAANRITTGTGADVNLPVGASVDLIYDAGDSLWRVTSSVAASGGYTSGITTVGAVSATSNANGATITGNTINLSVADASNAGLVSTTTQAFQGAKTFNSLLTAGAGLTATGTVTFSSLGAGLAQLNSSGVLSSGVVDRNSASYFNTTLSTANGGTGLTGFTANGIVYASSTSALAQATGTSGQLMLANGSNVPTFTTLSGDATINSTGVITIANNAITSAKINDGTIVNADLAAGTFANITGVGTLGAGSIASGFGTISTTSTITTTATITGATVQTTGGNFSANTAGNVTAVLSATTGANLVCQNASNVLSTCSNTYAQTNDTTNFIRNQTTQQASSNFNISGSGTAGSFLSSNFDSTGSNLGIGSTTATAISIGNAATATGVSIYGGNNGISLASTNAVTITAGAPLGASIQTTNVASGNSGQISLKSGNATAGTAGTITIDTGTSSTGTSQINIGTGTGSKTITVGSASSSGTTNVYGGTGGVNIGTLGGPISVSAYTGLNLNTIDLSGINTGTVSLQSGNGIASASSGAVVISSGSAKGGGQTVGSVSIDTGAANLGATAGSITIGTASSSGQVTIGRSGITTNIQGGTQVALSGTTGTTLVCQNASSLLSSCDSSYLAPTAGNFIQNGTAQQTGNFNILNANAASVAAVIQAASGQSANLFQINDSTGANTLFKVGSTGTVSINNPTNTNSLSINTLGTTKTGFGIAIQTSGTTPYGILVQRSGASNNSAFEVQAGTGGFLAAIDQNGVFITDGNNSTVGGVFRSATASNNSAASNKVTLQSGDATGANASSGNVYVDAGAKNGTGTTGTVNIGTTNASAINIGSTGIQTTVLGGNLTLGTITGGAGATQGTLTLGDGSNRSITITSSGSQAGSYNVLLPTITANDTFCLQSKGNCLISNQVTGTGSNNHVARFSGTNSIADGILYDTGTSGFAGVNITSQLNNSTFGIIARSTDVALTVQGNGSNIAEFKNSSAATKITIDSTGSLSLGTGTQFTNAGSTVLTAYTFATGFSSDGDIGTAAATVDIYSTFKIPQTVSARTLSLPTPSTSTAGRLAYVINTGTSAFTMHSVSIQPGKAQTYVFDGSNWTATNIDGAGSGATFIGTIDTKTKSTDGAVISGNGLYLQTADNVSGGHIGLVSTGAQGFTGAKTFDNLLTGNGGLTVNGADISLNASSNFNTNINTGNSTGSVTIGNTLAGAISLQTANSVGIISGTTGTNFTVGNTTSNPNVSFVGSGSFGTTTGAVSLNGNAAVATGKTFTVTNGATSLTGSLTQSGGAFSLTGNGLSTITTATGATTSAIGLSTGASSAGASGGISITSGNATGGTAGSVSIDTGSGGSPAITIGGTNASTVTIGNTTAATAVTINAGSTGGITLGANTSVSGNLTVAANKNLSLTSGTGTITQNYSSTSGSGATHNATNSGTSGINSVNSISIGLTGSNTTGTNNTSGISFAAPSTGTGTQNFYGLNFATAGYTDILRVGSSQIINGSGVLQSAGLSGSYTGSVQFNNAADTFGGLSATLSGAVQGGSFTNGGTFTVSGTGVVKYVDGTSDSATLVCKNSTGQLAACNTSYTTTSDTTTFIRNQTNAQTGNFNISGTGIAATSLQAPSFQTADTSTASTNTAAVTFRSGNSTTSGNTGNVTIVSGDANSGASGSITIDNGAFTSGTGVVSIANSNRAHTVSIANGSGAQAVTIGSTSSTSSLTLNAGTGNLSITTQGTGILGVGNNGVAQIIQVGNTTSGTSLALQAGTGGVNLTGAFSVNGDETHSAGKNISFASSATGGNFDQSLATAGTFKTGGGAVSLNGDVTIASGKNFSQSGGGTFQTGTGNVSLQGATSVSANFTVSNAGNVAFQRNTTDISAPGTLTDLVIGNGVLFRFTGTSTQTLTSIANPADGRVLTLINAGTQALVLQQDNGVTGTATNRIITGTGGNISVPVGATVQLTYDSSAARWRVIGSSAAAGGAGVNGVGTIDSQTKSTDGAVVVGTSLVLQTADNLTGGHVGLVSTGAQGFTGAKTFDNLLTASNGLAVTTGAISLQGNAASYLKTSVGNLTLDAAAALNLGDTNATSVVIGNAANSTSISLNGSGAVNILNGTTGTSLNVGNTTSNPSISFNGSGTFGTTTGTISLNGNTQVAANKNLTLLSGTGSFNQTYVANANSAANFTVTNSGSTGTNTVNGLNLALAGTAGGTNTINAINFVGATGVSGNTFNGLNFGTGYNTLINSANVVVNANGTVNLTNATTGSALNIVQSINPGAGSALIFANNTNASASGNLIDLRANNNARFSVDAGGNVVNLGGINAANTAFTVDGTTGNVTTSGALKVGSGGPFQVANTGAVTNNSTYNTNTFTSSNLNFGSSTNSSISINIAGAGTTGGNLTVSGGTSGSGSVNGGDVILSGGTSGGTGVQGQVKLSTSTFTAAGLQTFGSNGNVSQASVDSSSTLDISSTNVGVITIGIPAPTTKLTGRLLYVTISGSNSVNINPSGGNQITMNPNTAVTLVWNTNANGWLNAGADGGSNTYIQNQNTSQQTGANFRIGGTGQADSGLVAPSLERATTGTLSIGTSSNTTAISLGSSNLTGTLAIDSGASSTITIGSTATARTINLGNVAAAQTITIGSTNTTSSLALQGGTNGVSITAGAGSTPGTITVGNTTTTGTQQVNIGTNGTASSTTNVTVGSTVAGSTLLQSAGGTTVTSTTNPGTLLTVNNGSGTPSGNLLNLQTGGTNNKFTVDVNGVVTLVGGNTTDIKTTNAAGATNSLSIKSGDSSAGTSGAVTVDTGSASTGTPALNLGNTNARTIQLGNASAATVTNISGGTTSTGNGAVSIQAGAGGLISIGSTTNASLAIGTGAVAGTLTVGGTAQTGGITVGQSTATNAINIGNAVTASGNTQTVNIATATATGGTATINIGTSTTGTSNVLVGNTAAGTTTVQSAGGLNINTTTTIAAGKSLSFTAGSGTLTQNYNTTGTAALIASTGNATNLSLTSTAATSANLFNINQSTSTYTGTAIFVNAAAGSGSFTGKFVDLQNNGSSKFTVDANGNVLTNGTITTGSAAGTGGLVNNGTTINTAATTVTSTVNVTLTASSTVDSYTYIPVTSSTGTGVVFTIPAPTTPVNGRLIYVTNVGTNTFSFGNTFLTSTLKGGATASLIWATVNGTGNWTYAGSDAGGIFNQTNQQTGASFNIDGSGTAASFKVTAGTGLFDTATAGLLNIGTSSATSIALGGTTNTGTLIQSGANGTNVQSTNDSTAAFTATNSVDANVFTVDTSNTNAGANLALNGGVEQTGTNFTNNWIAFGSSTVTQDSTAPASGTYSAKAAVTATNSGVRTKSGTLTTGATYVVSFNAMSSTASTNDLKVDFYSTAATFNANCANLNGSGNTASLNTIWTKYTCSFTAASGSGVNAGVVIYQTSGTSRNIFVDNLSLVLQTSVANTQNTSLVRVGGPTSQGLTLFQLDTYAANPFTGSNAALAGAMYFDTTQGKMQCYDGAIWGACGAAPTSIVTLSPEFTGAVLHGTSGTASVNDNNIGTMTSDFCSNFLGINDATHGTAICGTNETYNFYRWTSPQSNAQTYDIYITYQLPGTFNNFVLGQTNLLGRTDSSNATVTYTVYKNVTGTGLSLCSASKTVSTGTQTSWQTATPTTDLSTCGFAANNSVVVKVEVTSSSNANAYVGNLNFSYTNK